MGEAVNEKHRCFKLWKAGSVRLQSTTQSSRHQNVQFTRPEVRLRSLLSRKIYLRSADIYRLAQQMQLDNQDVIGEKSVENNASQLALEEEAKNAFWMEHNKHLLNVEFPCNQEYLSDQSKSITFEMITNAITKIASGKAAGPP